MTNFGFTLSSEEHGPRELVRLAQRAEEAGFEFCSISDHFHPWTQRQGHSPFVWSVIGAVAHATDRIRIGTGVTCPIVRMHPAVVAHATATASLLCEGRFFFGVGTGEALNEHVTATRWPPPAVRREMLEEAVGIIRDMWTGETLEHRGCHYEVENARIFDPPVEPPQIIVSAFGPEATDLAARIGDGLWGHTPDPDAVAEFERAGGSGPRYAQLNVCVGPDEERCRSIVHEVWPNGGLPGQMSQDLPTWTHFEQASSLVSVAQATEHVPCGNDPGPIVDLVRSFRDAGFDHLYFHQIGPDQGAFFRLWTEALADAVAEVTLRTSIPNR